MALHTELPIYKVAYDLLDAITDLARNMPRYRGHCIDKHLSKTYRHIHQGDPA